MEWYHFAVSGVWVALFWLRRRRHRESARLTASDGRLRDMGGRGGF